MTQMLEDELEIRQRDFNHYVEKYLQVKEALEVKAARKTEPRGTLARFLATGRLRDESPAA